MKDIVASIIATSQKEIDKRVDKVKDAVNIIQLDIMDGKYAPNEVLNFKFTLPENSCTVEADLMVKNPEKWIEQNFDIADNIIVHINSTDDIYEIIEKVRKKGKKISLALDPENEAEDVIPYLGLIDQVMVFTAERIGFYGAPFNQAAVGKIRKIRKVSPDILIEVDGGVTPDNIDELSKAGVNLFVSGSYLQNSNDVEKAVASLRNIIDPDELGEPNEISD